jgi:hypothetical protein
VDHIVHLVTDGIGHFFFFSFFCESTCFCLKPKFF